MYQIKLLDKISPLGLALLEEKNYTHAADLDKPDAVLVRSSSMHDLDLGDQLLAIARAGAGVNNIPLDHYAKQGVVVFNTPGANANAVKELVLLGLLISSRKVPAAMQWLHAMAGQNACVESLVEKQKSKYVGPELMGKTLGVIGLGAIGVLVANAAASLGMTVLGYDPYLRVEAAWGLSKHVHHAKSLQEVFSQSDYLTLHLPTNKHTKQMIDSAAIATMKTGVRLLNFSRGDLIHTDDVLAALTERQLSYYVTDFPNDALLDNPYVIAFPHLGASTPESENNCATMAAAQIIDYLEHGNIKNAVNFPDAAMPRTDGARICVIHQNVPSMVSQITTLVSTKQLNISNMLNASKEDLAYTLLDLPSTQNFSPDTATQMVADLSAIEGIIKVRVL